MALLNGEVDGFSLNGSVLNPYQLSLSQLCFSNWEDFESAFWKMVFKFIEKIYIHVNKYDTHQLWIILSLILWAW